VATLPSSGAPHTTATWFLVEDGTFKCSWEPTKQKVRNLVRDPRCTVMLLARIPYAAALAVLARTGERVASGRLGLTAVVAER